MMTARCAIGEGLRALRRCDGSTTRDIGDSLCACAVREDPAENYGRFCGHLYEREIGFNRTSERYCVFRFFPPKVSLGPPLGSLSSSLRHAKEAEC